MSKRKRIRPRLGLKHQVQIPPMVTTSTSEYVQLLKYSEESEKLNRLPGLLVNRWSEAEKDAFLFGLYMFGKNFVKVKNFMENKDMGQILAFYYSRSFYKSEGFGRWLSSRKKMKKVHKRRCISFGRKIFKGRRLDQILYCLHPHVSDDLQATLLEVSVLFEGRKTSLEDFLSFLKATVGIDVLVDAVGIGMGKRDFTILENTNRVSSRLLPNGKALSSLTPSDIVRYLSGSFMSNTAWCEDIFWEVVWPRLLGRGWNSEKSINQGYVRNTLVFLVPGIDKFSRRGLKKRDQYFDTIDDVLKKILAEPNLIKLESDTERGPEGQMSDQVGAERSSINNADDNNDIVPPLKRRRITTAGGKEEGKCRSISLPGDNNTAIVNFSAEGRKIEDDMREYISAFDTPHPETERQISAICIDLTHWQESPPRKFESQNNPHDQSMSGRIVRRISARADTDVKALEPPPPVHTRRQSSRNRPLSTKALEALETGLWDLPARTTTTTTRSKDCKPEIRSGRSRIKTSPTQTTLI